MAIPLQQNLSDQIHSNKIVIQITDTHLMEHPEQEFIQINPEQIFDIHTFVSLIICSEKQGNRNVKSL